jgi:hypothetical protein
MRALLIAAGLLLSLPANAENLRSPEQERQLCIQHNAQMISGTIQYLKSLHPEGLDPAALQLALFGYKSAFDVMRQGCYLVDMRGRTYSPEDERLLCVKHNWALLRAGAHAFREANPTASYRDVGAAMGGSPLIENVLRGCYLQ